MTLRHCLIATSAFAVALAVGVAEPAEAAGKHKKRYARSQAAPMQTMGRMPASYSGGGISASGPLYNGQDYLGTDPDPFIRSQILRDLSLRYGGGAD
jgi:hypothetical protein